ncbi:hypothetical protein [Micromonospora sp. NPDC050695]|uniref:hypothetical protein n=1 Tax=Micromonospora sp. NPDC050695 TaxID=3154938 RepID=UPI0033FBDB4C
MGDALGGLRLTVIMLLGLGALVAWLIVAHDLWEKPTRETPAELARLFNLGTILRATGNRRYLSRRVVGRVSQR